MNTDIKSDVIELQTRISFLEDVCDSLSQIIARQDRQLIDMQDQLKILYAQLTARQTDAEIAPFDLMADKPPHY